MEQIRVAHTIIELKKVLAHGIGGSVFINNDLFKQLCKLNGRDKTRLEDELLFRHINLRRMKDENSKRK